MTDSRNPDANVPLGGGLPDFEGEPRTLLRDFDCLVIPAMTLSPAGVTELEALIGAYRNEVARYRLRTLDLEDFGVHEDAARAELATIPRFEGTELQVADWNDVAERLHAMRQYGGYAELRKLCTLLTADEVPATEAAS
jgi:hypothetical protein